MTSTRTAQSTVRWTPPEGPDAVQLPAGVDWDAVEVPAYLGGRVLAWLGEQSGAVIRDPYGHRMIWLVPPGAGASWTFPDIAATRVLGAGCHVIVPPGHRVRSAHSHWTRPAHGVTPPLTDPDTLHEALDAVITDTLGPRTAATP